MKVGHIATEHLSHAAGRDQTKLGLGASNEAMAIYNLHVCRDLSQGYVLSLFPKASERQGNSVEKIRYRNVEDLVAGLKALKVPDEPIASLRTALEERAPFTISEVPATADDLAGLSTGSSPG